MNAVNMLRDDKIYCPKTNSLENKLFVSNLIKTRKSLYTDCIRIFNMSPT
jgi:hypothetical protein